MSFGKKRFLEVTNGDAIINLGSGEELSIKKLALLLKVKLAIGEEYYLIIMA